MHQRALAVAIVALAALSLAGCSGTSGTSSGSSGASGGTTIDVTIKGSSLTPNGERVKVGVGEPVTLKITADRAGELHVHSTPEQHIDFPRGSSTKTVTVRSPGIVDIEDHALDKVVVQLQVS